MSKKQQKKLVWKQKKAAIKKAAKATQAAATTSLTADTPLRPTPTPSEAWEIFHTRHSQGKFFKPKRYLVAEFPEVMSLDTHDTLIVDAGCGNGAAIVPFLRATKHLRATAFDCSKQAIKLLQSTVKGTEEGLRIESKVCDMVQAPLPLAANSCRAGLLIFVLSAVPIAKMPLVLKELHRVLRPNALLCFRDYGIYDMSHLRSTKEQWLGGRTFCRGDEHTLVTFFDLSMLRALFVQCGYVVDELKYACVEITNRKTTQSWRRCFVHAKVRTLPVVSGGDGAGAGTGAGAGAGAGGEQGEVKESIDMSQGVQKIELGAEQSLSVRPSQIGAIAGDGLFVTRCFKKGAIVCVYKGDVYNTHDAMRLKNKDYLMRLGTQKYIDARTHLQVVGRYINDCKHALLYNVAFDKRPDEDCANVVALRDIYTNEELFVDYGWKYWLSVKGKRLSPGIAVGILQRIEEGVAEAEERGR
jgi:methyltransferase-like protein 6